MLLDTLLAIVRTTSNERFVLISNYTQTLDLCERLCQMRKYALRVLSTVTEYVPIPKYDIQNVEQVTSICGVLERRMSIPYKILFPPLS